MTSIRPFTVLVLFLLSPITAHSVANSSPEKIFEMSGKIYIKKELDPSCGKVNRGYACSKPNYGTFHVVSNYVDGQVVSYAEFGNNEGVQVIEQAWVNGIHIQKGILENKQLGFTTTLEIQNGFAEYTQKFTNGKVKVDREKAEENLVLPSSLMAYLKPKFPKIINGETVQIRMAVMDRRESFRFDVSKDRTEIGPDGSELLVLKMKPHSFWVSQVVDPMYFFVNLKQDKVIGFDGRSALQRKEGSKFKPIEAIVAYNVILDKPVPVATTANKPMNTLKDETLKIGPKSALQKANCLESNVNKCAITK